MVVKGCILHKKHAGLSLNRKGTFMARKICIVAMTFTLVLSAVLAFPFSYTAYAGNGVVNLHQQAIVLNTPSGTCADVCHFKY